jgi:hypothetical protein
MGTKEVRISAPARKPIKMPKLQVVIHNATDDRFIDVDDPREAICTTLRELGFNAEPVSPSP